MRTSRYLVRLKCPAGVSQSRMVEYITSACSEWKGQLLPPDPLVHLDYTTIKVKVFRKRRAKGEGQ